MVSGIECCAEVLQVEPTTPYGSWKIAGCDLFFWHQYLVWLVSGLVQMVWAWTDEHVLFQSGGDEDSQSISLAATEVQLYTVNKDSFPQHPERNWTFGYSLCLSVQTVDGGQSGLHFPTQVSEVPNILQFFCSKEDWKESIINNVKHQEVSDPIPHHCF